MSLNLELKLNNIKKILVCQLRQLGDVIISTASVKLLANKFPNAEIHFLTEKKCEPLLINNPHIHKIWTIDKKELSTLFKQFKFYKEVANNNFDLIVDFQQLPRCKWVVFLSKAPIKLTYPPKWYNRWLYTNWWQTPKLPAVPYKASTLKPLGIEWNGEAPELFIDDSELKEVEEILSSYNINSQDEFYTIDATHRHKTREWPKEHYAKLIDLLVNYNNKLKFILLYGPGEKEVVEAIKNLSLHPSNIVITKEMLSLRQAAAVISLARLHIGNCSAPRHMATAVNTPSLTILGSTSNGWTFPSSLHTSIALNLDCQPCNKNNCPIDFKCLKLLTPKVVFESVINHINSIKSI